MRILNDVPPDAYVFWQVHTSATRSDASVGRYTCHLGEDQSRSAMSVTAHMHQIEVVWRTIMAGVHGHWRDDDPVRQDQFAQPEWGEHWWNVPLFQSATLCDPALDAGNIRFVAQSQIFVGDTLATCEQAISKLFRFKSCVTLDVLKSVGTITRSILELDDFNFTLRFIRTLLANVLWLSIKNTFIMSSISDDLITCQ
jgi:hypothetical protein